MGWGRDRPVQHSPASAPGRPEQCPHALPTSPEPAGPTSSCCTNIRMVKSSLGLFCPQMLPVLSHWRCLPFLPTELQE